MPDAPMHPQPCVRKVKARKQVTTGSPVDPAFPARWLYGFLRALPGEPGFLATIIGAMREHFADLISASGYQDHTTSPSASTRLVLRIQSVHRIPHPTFVTTAIRPSKRGGMARAFKGDLPDGARGFFSGRGQGS